MGLVLTLCVEVVDGVAVGQDYGLIAPLVAEYVLEETLVGAARHTFVPLVCAHHLTHVGILHKRLECRKIGLPEIPHRNPRVETVAEWFRSAVNGIMLGAGVGLVIIRIVTLHAPHCLNSEHAGQIRVLTVGLLSPSPSRVTEYVYVRTPE